MEDQALRMCICKTGRELLENRLVARTWGNVSARADDMHYLVTPSGMDYGSITPEDIALCDLADGKWTGPRRPSGERAVHALAYSMFEDVNFVIHTHQTYASALGLPIAIGDKERVDHTENAQVLEVIGNVEGKDCLVVDDFTISGGTLINLAESLRQRGCKRIFALLSHNIISARGVTKIDASPIEAVFSTDTVDNPNIIGHPKFKTISVAPMFAETIMRFYNYESISSMFSQLPESIVRAGFELTDLKL